MKLTKKKVNWLIRRKKEGMRSKKVGLGIKVTKRRVNQVWKMYRERGEIPVIGENLGRPKTSNITEEEKKIIKEAKNKYKLGARRLEPIIERDHRIHIPHNKIHKCLLEEGLAKENPKKKKRRKWIRYERKHSMSAGHMDWHDGKNGKKVCAIEDDASRKVLVGVEFEHDNEENSIALFEKMVKMYWDIRPLRELIIDNGSHFGAHRTNEKGEWNSAFKRAVEKYGTKIIRTSVKHPQTNGKIEKFYDLYVKYREDFDSLDDFIEWYNKVRPHESLGWKHINLETPEEAFWRKLPTECFFGVASRLFGWL